MQIGNFIVKKMKQQLILLTALQGLLLPYMSMTMNLPHAMVPIYQSSGVSQKDLTILYRGEKKLYYHLPDQSVEDLQNFFSDKKEFCTVLNPVIIARDWSDPDWTGKSWSDKNWQDNHYRLIHGVKDEFELQKCKELYEQGVAQYLISKNIPMEEIYSFVVARDRYASYLKCRRSLGEVSNILETAKNIIKSFVLSDSNLEIDFVNNFIKKSGKLGRLFTYAKLHQIIAEKNLDCIRLPRKIVRIKDIASNKYISGEETLQILDEKLKVCLHEDRTFLVEFTSDKHVLEIFATFEKKQGKGLSQKTLKQLKILCKKAPFDIGYDNIFWDIQGNAIIIDTEYKDTQKSDWVKLGRYPVDENL